MYYLVKSFHRKVYTKLHVVNSIILKVNFMTRSHVEWVDVILKRNSRSIETFLFLLRIALSSKNRNKFATARKITRMTKCELPKTFWLQLHIWSIFLFWQFLKFFVDRWWYFWLLLRPKLNKNEAQNHFNLRSNRLLWSFSF